VALGRVRSVGAITGAGVSAESGIPTYRGKGGIYDDPVEGDRTVEALSGWTLARDPDRTWRAIAALARHARGAFPNAGHLALVEIERRAERFCLLTQNVDGLHRRAGSSNVIDIHGDIFATRCTGCGRRDRKDDIDRLAAAPRCAACAAVLRPDAVLFGEMLPADKVARMHAELVAASPELVLVAGTSALFPYIVSPVEHACRRGRLTVEVNPEPTALSDLVDFALRGPAGDLLPLVAAALPARAA
jgi:NAD-dependent deacetylase